MLHILYHSLTHTPLPAQTRLITEAFALGMTLFGLCLDLLSLYFWWERKRRGDARSSGLPYVPWMLYFLASVFWCMRGQIEFAAVWLFVFTVWHIGVHVTIHGGRRRPLQHQNQK